MPNEVIITVKAVNDTKAVFDAIRADARKLGDTIAVDVNKQTTQRLEQEARASAASGGGFSRAGDTIGDVIGRKVAQRISERVRVSVDENVRETVRARGGDNDTTRIIRTGGGTDNEHVTVHDRDRETVHVNVDVDQKTLLQKIASFGSSIKDKVSGFFGDGLKTGITSVFSGDAISTIIKGGLITLATVGLAPALGAAITSGVLLALGGGAIAIGIAGAFKDPRIQTAVTGLKERLKKSFADFSSNFLGPLENFFAPGNGGGGGIVGVLDQIDSMVQSIGRTFGQVADQLGNGIIGFLQNALPGILRAIDASAPIVKVLADELPGIGDAIGRFFDSIRDGAPGATVFFKDLLNFVEWIIPKIGILIEAFTIMYTTVRTIFLRLNVLAANWADALLTAASAAFSWIPGMQGKLLTARRAVEKFRDGANRALHDVDDVDIAVRFHVFGLAAANAVINTTRTLNRLGYINKETGGVVGTAATGGSRNGLTLVGENGPELAEIAPGGRVHSNADTRRMLAGDGGGQGGPMIINLIVDGMTIARATLNPMRQMIGNEYGGSVQAAYGR